MIICMYYYHYTSCMLAKLSEHLYLINLCLLYIIQTSYSHFQSLDERINLVATKVVHLGDQLEGVNTPRARAVEAQRLMNYLDEFMSDEPPKSAVFTDPFQVAKCLFMNSLSAYVCMS